MTNECRAHVRQPVKATELAELPVELSPEAPHRLRRAEDLEDLEIRERVFQRWLMAMGQESPRRALMVALDDYKQELAILAVRRLGLDGTR